MLRRRTERKEIDCEWNKKKKKKETKTKKVQSNGTTEDFHHFLSFFSHSFDTSKIVVIFLFLCRVKTNADKTRKEKNFVSFSICNAYLYKWFMSKCVCLSIVSDKNCSLLMFDINSKSITIQYFHFRLINDA